LQLYADGGYHLRIRSLDGTPNYGPRQIARIWERKTRDLNQVKCIKDEMDQLLVKGQDIK
jgi:hypothetical protein